MSEHENADFGFILFSPDCTTTRRHLDAIAWLRQRGVVFRNFAWKKLNSAEIGLLYAENRRKRGSGPLDELVNRLFLLDYSLAALVVVHDISDVHTYLIDLKGPSDPAEATTDHLRRWLGATNKILNFIHTSETASAAATESSLFFDTQQPWTSSEVPPPPRLLGQIASVSGFSVRCRLKRLATAGHSEALINRFHKLLQDEEVLLSSVRDHLAILPDLHELLRHQLDEIHSWPEGLVASADALRMLCLRSLTLSIPSTGYDELLMSLRRLGIHLSEWDDLVLACERWSP